MTTKSRAPLCDYCHFYHYPGRCLKEATDKHRALKKLKRDYGFDNEGWQKVREMFEGLETGQIENLLNPSPHQLKTVWTTCSRCGEEHPDMEPLDSEAYLNAMYRAILRKNRCACGNEPSPKDGLCRHCRTNGERSDNY